VAAVAAVVIKMPEEEKSPAQARPTPAECAHEYQMDDELETWVCANCGSALDLVTQVQRHECGPDCDRHGDVSAIG